MPSSSRSRGSGRGPDGAPRPPVLAPMSERQQLALVMQMSSQDIPRPVPTPAEERKKKRHQRNERGETPLHVAAIRGDPEQVKKLLDQGLDPNVPDFAGWTALHEACSYGWYDVVELLVKNGADPNAKGLDNDTPLHDATTSGNLKMVKLLVNHGAEPFKKNTKGKMPSDYAAAEIYDYLLSLKDINARAHNVSRSRDDSTKKGGNASTSTDYKRSNMDTLAHGDHFEAKDPIALDNEATYVSSSVVSSTQDENSSSSHKRVYVDEGSEADPLEDDVTKKKKRNEEKELMGKPTSLPRSSTGRILTGSKPPGPASKTGAAPLKNPTGSKSSSSKGHQSQSKSSSSKSDKGSHAGKSSGSSKGSSSGKLDRKSPVASPKSSGKDADHEHEEKSHESSAPKVPPLKIVLGGGSGARGEQEGDSGAGARGGGKGRGSGASLPYVIPCSADTGQTSDSSDGNCDDKRVGEGGKPGQRVLRSHKTNDDKDKERISPGSNALSSNKSPNSSGHDHDHVSSSRTDSSPSVELHPRKRKMKSKESHHRESRSDHHEASSAAHHIAHSNPYQMYLHVRKQIERRQKGLFPVKPKPPKDFNKYLMNRCTYTLQTNMNVEPSEEIPKNLPHQMIKDFKRQDKERADLRMQHVAEKERLVLAVELEILRVHGRAERAVANQAVPFSVCTMLRDQEVYNILAPDQEEKRNAQRSRCNGRQINSWLQEVDDKWEKIKEAMLRRQNIEAQALHAEQSLGWIWKLREQGLCDYKTNPNIDPTHVPQVHVSNFDLPA